MTNIVRLTWEEVRNEAQKIAFRHAHRNVFNVYGVPQGGAPIALMVAQELNLPIVEEPEAGRTLIVDDLVDSGTTLEKYRLKGFYVDAAFRKPHSPQELAPLAHEVDGWLAFPWERDDGNPTDSVVRILQHIGEDPSREGLLDTPKRVIKAFKEMTEGYSLDAATVLGTTFDEPQDEMIVVTGIPFSSLCEHHMLPFTGTATVGYVPSDRIVGLSKIARLVEMYARRLQVQERLTLQVAEAIEQHLDAEGVGVIISGKHSCMSLRGVRKEASMVTQCFLGSMRDNQNARQEFLSRTV